MNKIFMLLTLAITSFSSYAQDKVATTVTTSTPVAPAAPAPKIASSATYGTPKNPIEIGISGGLHTIWGDVNSNVKFDLDNSTFGLHIRKALTYAFSWRLQYNYGNATMRDNSPHYTAQYNNIAPAYGMNTWFPASQAYSHSLSWDQVFTLGNSSAYKNTTKWTVDLFAGPALVAYRTVLDVKNANGNPYANTNWGGAENAFNTYRDLAAIDGGKKAMNEAGKILDNTLDGKYETEAAHKARALGDYSLTAALAFGGSVNKIISNKLSLSLEQRMMYLFDDYIDGERFANFASVPQYSQNNDFIANTTLKLGYFMGKKGSTPLYWRNANEETNKKLAAMNPKKAINEAMADDDADGVPNILDQEATSREGCPVDTKGVMLDSDKDGLVDCDDSEPYSAPGFPVDAKGVAKVPAPACCTELTKKMATPEVPANNVPVVVNSGDCGEMIFPTVKFDKDKFGLNSAMAPALAEIGNKMQKCPDMKLVINGINDKNNKNGKYNEQLSYNRAMEVANFMKEKFGVSNDRFIIRYNLDGTDDAEADRAVMFRSAQEGESGNSNPPSPHPGLKAGKK